MIKNQINKMRIVINKNKETYLNDVTVEYNFNHDTLNLKCPGNQTTNNNDDKFVFPEKHH